MTAWLVSCWQKYSDLISCGLVGLAFCAIAANFGSVDYKYDDAGRIESVTYTSERTVTTRIYVYDARGNATMHLRRAPTGDRETV